MANLYFDESLSTLVPGEHVTVSGDEGRHAARVSRLRVGEHTLLGDGRGQHARGETVHVDRDSFTVRIEHVEHAPKNSRRVVLVQALAKGDRDERAVEQATEFGVDAIIPWQAERSVSRWSDEKAAKGMAKWARIAREAAKQSLRPWIPEILPPASTPELTELDGHVLVLHPGARMSLSDWQPVDDRDIYLVVGPEGGLSEAELNRLAVVEAQVGAPEAAPSRQTVLLGDTVLRTSSAGPAALAVVNTILGRW